MKLANILLDHRYRSIAAGETTSKSEYHYSDYEGNYKVTDVQRWLASLDETKDWELTGQDGGDMTAFYYESIPYTEEEIEEAKAWIKLNPVDSSSVKFTPFTIDSTIERDIRRD